MPVEILMPKLGLTMTEATVIEWYKREGDVVARGDILFVLETEKVAYEVEAPEDGTLARIIVQQNETVPVGTIMGYLLKSGESADKIPAGPQSSAKKLDTIETPAIAAIVSTAAPTGGRIRATPLAKKIARELNVALSSVSGSGPSGRIIADDVKKAATLGSPAVPQRAAVAVAETVAPLTRMRQAIAKNMMSAKLETAQTYMTLQVDASQIVASRKALLPAVEEKNRVRLTITDLMMKITGHAIVSHPVINTSWTEKGVVYFPTVHMGMAMAMDEGLIVPVIRDINAKSLGQIAADRTSLIAKVREARLLPDDVKGSTFTVSTLGQYGIESFTANINRPESAILAVGAIMDKAVVVDGHIAIRPMMKITLTYDHRIIDGAEAAKFMQTLKSIAEEPIRLLQV